MAIFTRKYSDGQTQYRIINHQRFSGRMVQSYAKWAPLWVPCQYGL